MFLCPEMAKTCSIEFDQFCANSTFGLFWYKNIPMTLPENHFGGSHLQLQPVHSVRLLKHTVLNSSTGSCITLNI